MPTAKTAKPQKGLKYGNPSAANSPPVRPLNDSEKVIAIAEYQKHADIRKCASVVNVDIGVMVEFIAEIAEKGPAILENPRAILVAGMLCRQIGKDCLTAAQENTKDLWGKGALISAKIADQMADGYIKGYKEKVGSAAEALDADAIDEAMVEEERKLAELRDAGTAASAPADGTKAPGGGTAPVGPDAEHREGETGR